MKVDDQRQEQENNGKLCLDTETTQISCNKIQDGSCWQDCQVYYPGWVVVDDSD